jgi:hypothetical protein
VHVKSEESFVGMLALPGEIQPSVVLSQTGSRRGVASRKTLLDPVAAVVEGVEDSVVSGLALPDGVELPLELVEVLSHTHQQPPWPGSTARHWTIVGYGLL